jgi:hypothetical protein
MPRHQWTLLGVRAPKSVHRTAANPDPDPLLPLFSPAGTQGPRERNAANEALRSSQGNSSWSDELARGGPTVSVPGLITLVVACFEPALTV